ncbi:MAG: hypothetical protein JNJ69_19125 [Leptospiraceae bacterium]|nr:hypothetical protein [Leptospiraceae bacterium]
MTNSARLLIADFKAKSAAELDSIFCSAGPARLPATGNYRGTWLARIENAGTYKPFNLISQWLMFEVTPFGITFSDSNSGIWYFFNPALAAGNFVMRAEASRWRNTQCVTLNYESANLPGPVRDILYDEVKVIDDEHALGIGGFKGPAGDGDNFYFLLTRE